VPNKAAVAAESAGAFIGIGIAGIILGVAFTAAAAYMVVDSVATICEAFSCYGYNFMRDGLCAGNVTAYRILAIAGAALMIAGSIFSAYNLANIESVKAMKWLRGQGLSRSEARGVIKAFNNGLRVETLATDTTVYRVWGGASERIGPWVSPNNYGDAARSMLALPPWNSAAEVSTFVLPSGTQVLTGTAAPLGVHLGGGVQWWVATRFLILM